ncbi:pseudouridine synthase [Zhihengliuella sp.]|uniref:pseudouridine synthase n=1 Tax=Zhihengliuella sp. TaxID=1954483 RepID=UPI002810E8D2|nr:pseudouridine synthase [Zhihengliuella sp.]
MKSPLPVRNGVGATRLRLPEAPRAGQATVLEHLVARFGHIDPGEIAQRFDDGEVVARDGAPLSRATPLGAHDFVWYYRTLPPETPIPFEERVLAQDRDLLVVDKPHFLPTTPGGGFLQESALVRLRNRLGLPELTPIHRLDRATAGVILFSVRAETRGAYQTMFERRTVRKEYECVSALPAGVRGDGLRGGDDSVDLHDLGGFRGLGDFRDLGNPRDLGDFREFPVVVRSRIRKTKGELRVRLEDGPANAESAVELLATGASGGHRAGLPVAHFRLTPHTGKTHQLRVHMASLGLGILNDVFYPDLLDKAPDDYDRPLQLLARSIEFPDPVTGNRRRFESGLRLAEAPVAEAPAGPPA